MVIRFTPIGARMLMGAPMDLLTDRTIALEDLDSRFSRLLTGHARVDVSGGACTATAGCGSFA